jgi:hypothetical protein
MWITRSSLFLILNWIQLIKWSSYAHDDWDPISYPIEEKTSGIEFGGGRWGHPIKVHVKTSKREFAETLGSIFITFYGKRATSEKFLLKKGFNAGALDTIDLHMTREIGELEQVKIQTNSTDGWLFASIWLDIGPRTYFLESSSFFLDMPNNDLADLNWDGDSRGNSFFADPVGKLNELYEPQAPTKSSDDNEIQETPHQRREGLLGKEVMMLKVESYVDNYEDPFQYQEDYREQWDP